MGKKLAVDTAALRAKAQQVATPVPPPPGPAAMPDGLGTTVSLVGGLDSSAQQIGGSVSAGDVEAQRMAGCLNAAAQAYDDADAQSAKVLNGQMTGDPSAPAGLPLTPVLPNTAGIPPRVTITPASPPPNIPSGGYHDWQEAARTIWGGDTKAASVSSFAENWRTYQQVLSDHARNFTPDVDGWHGTGASACGKRLSAHQDWLNKMAAQAGELSRQATTFVAAHTALVGAHPTAAEAAAFDATEWQSESEKWIVWQELQALSEAALGDYADTVLLPLNPPAPPSGCDGGPGHAPPGSQPGKGDKPGGDQPGGKKPGDKGDPKDDGKPEDKKPEEQKPEDKKPEDDKPEGDKPDSGDKPEMPEMPQMPSTLPASATMPSIPGSGTGSAAGSGTPGSGMPMMPMMPRLPSMPSMPRNAGVPAAPSMKPAHAGGGGGGPHGGGGKGSPMQPAMAPKSVGPGGHAPAAAGGGAGPGPGVRGGGMGGGMPMGGGHGGPGQGAKAKRQTGPEETIYTEDRAWTEGVIGNRKRKDTPTRKDTP